MLSALEYTEQRAKTERLQAVTYFVAIPVVDNATVSLHTAFTVISLLALPYNFCGFSVIALAVIVRNCHIC